MSTTPTEEGLRRYPATGGYHGDLSAKEDNVPDLDSPCTCAPACLRPCAGECGCEACSLRFAIFCDVAGISGPSGLDEEVALKRYRTPSVA